YSKRPGTSRRSHAFLFAVGQGVGQRFWRLSVPSGPDAKGVPKGTDEQGDAVFGAQAPNRQRGAESVAPSPDTRQKKHFPANKDRNSEERTTLPKQGPRIERKCLAFKERISLPKKGYRS